MSRRHLSFACEGETLIGTLDEGAASSGLLIVSGGNELRSGAFAGQARFAARLAAQGFPVFRFDRRGLGDSSGENDGFRGSREDILAALAAFRSECPQVQRVVAFGNCDAASALMLMRGDMCDALVLSNPWTYDDDTGGQDLPPPDAIRARYASRLRDPAQVLRLLRGGVNISSLFRGLKASLARSKPAGTLYAEIAEGLDAATKPYVILIADNDRTGQEFVARWDGTNGEVRRCAGASHAYVEPHARKWLEAQLLEMLRG
ncbi:MAG: hydrolase 1, exosortase A system-associated [Erythrobacter sp.]|nr:MAG: hydrolase 1, exosortase A system-associated [Erythrobacter sp.]